MQTGGGIELGVGDTKAELGEDAGRGGVVRVMPGEQGGRGELREGEADDGPRGDPARIRGSPATAVGLNGNPRRVPGTRRRMGAGRAVVVIQERGVLV